MNTGSFIVYIKTEDTQVDIAKDVEARCDISNYELNRSLLKRKNEKLNELMKDKLFNG